MITPEERAELRKYHVEGRYSPDGLWFSREGLCNRDMEVWPCPTVRLLDALEAVEALLRRARPCVAFNKSHEEEYGDAMAGWYEASVNALANLLTEIDAAVGS